MKTDASPNGETSYEVVKSLFLVGILSLGAWVGGLLTQVQRNTYSNQDYVNP